LQAKMQEQALQYLFAQIISIYLMALRAQQKCRLRAMLAL
jgi:hypothetical protein